MGFPRAALLVVLLPLAAGASASPLATDVAASSGLAFAHSPAREGGPYFQEMTAGGLCWGDHDADGWVDLVVTDTPGPGGDGGPRLFRNLGPDAHGNVRFADRTAAALPPGPGLAQGCVFADYDNDGFADLVVTYAATASSPRSLALLRNDAGRAFLDVTVAAGLVANGDWSIGAAWLDFDLDGDLDLYVANYVDAGSATCPDRGRISPLFCRGQANRLWRNDGGRFVDVAAAAGVARNAQPSGGRSMGVVAADLDGDGWTDLYVANDQDGNALYRNRGDGTFEDVAAASRADVAGGAATTGASFRAGMGTDANDADGDGDVDLLSTHLWGEDDALLLARAATPLAYEERRHDPAVRAMRNSTARWGAALADFDLDGARDLLVVAGGETMEETGPIHLALGAGGVFQPAGADAWPFGPGGSAGWRNHRGAAIADYDRDGDPDAAVAALDAPPARGGGAPEAWTALRLLRFEAAADDATWLSLTLVGTDSARDAIGARVRVTTEDGKVRVAARSSGGSYASGHDSAILVGLSGARRGVVEVTWPGGTAGPPTAFEVDADGGARLVVVEPDTRAPAPVTLDGAPVPVAEGVRLRWTPSLATDFARYVVYSGQGEVASRERATTRIEVPGRATTETILPAADWFAVAVADLGGRESGLSGEGRTRFEETPSLPAIATALALAAAAGWSRRPAKEPSAGML